MEHWRAVIPASHFVEVEYEALVREPEREIPELVGRLGLEWEAGCLEAGGSRSVNTPSLWQVRQPVYRSSIDRWRNYEAWGW